MNLFKSALPAVLLILAPGLWSEGKAEDPTPVRGSLSLAPAGAVISKISPLNVLPGTLVSVEGSGFGSQAASVRIGNVEITEFLEWTDTTVFFRIPKTGIPQAAPLQIGSAYSEGNLIPSPAGSITVLFIVDMQALVKKTAAEWQTVYKAPALPVFTPPLFVKGEWVKSEGAYGSSAVGTWDNGSKVRMLRDKTGNKWYAEVVLTPENQTSFGIKAMKFAFEDGNDEERNLSPYESDITYILKKDWANTDHFKTVHTDPAITPNPKDKLWVEGVRTIVVSYPPKS